MNQRNTVSTFILITAVVFALWPAAPLQAQNSITITSPNGGEAWEVGTTKTITWDSAAINGNVKIEYSTDNGNSWVAVEESTENDGIYLWKIPAALSSQCLLKVAGPEAAECETRGSWIWASGIDSLEKQAILFQKLEQANMNTILLSAPPINGNWGYGSHAMFLSCIIEAKKRGISVHAWIANTRRLWYDDILDVDYTDPAEQAAQSQWVQDLMGAYGDYLDGIHLDYIRYRIPGVPNEDGKMDGVRATVRRIHDDLEANYPGKRVSASVFNLNGNKFDRKDDGSIWFNMVPTWFVDWCADHPDTYFTSSLNYYYGPHHMQYQQDPVGWIKEGIIDRIMPMQYTLEDDMWQRDADLWKSFNQYVGNDFTRVHTGTAWKDDKWDPPGVVRKLKYDRSIGLKGTFIFIMQNHETDDTPLIEALTIDSEVNGFDAPYKTPVPSCMGGDGSAGIFDTSDTVFSIVRNPNAAISVLSPNGGESLGIGSSRDITWTCDGIADTLKIVLYKDYAPLGVIDSKIDPAGGVCTWTVGTLSNGTVVPTGTGYSIKIKEIGTTVVDFSDAPFAIEESGIVITSPNGGETFGSGTSQPITWSGQGISNTLKITLWKDNALAGVIASKVDPASGVYNWTAGLLSNGTVVPGGTGYAVKVKEKGTTVSDFSDGTFTIGSSFITVTSPNGGENWTVGSTRDITWDAAGITNTFKITLWQNGTYVGTIASKLAASARSFNWTVGELANGVTVPAGSGYTVKIKEKSKTIADTGDGGFTLVD